MQSLTEIFRIPSKIVIILLNGAYSMLSGNDFTEPKDYPQWMDIIALVVWGYIVVSLYNMFAFNRVYYVYACNDAYTSKCYRVKADYIEPECDSNDDSGSNCTEPSFSGINFENGGFIELDCIKNKDKCNCDSMSDDSSWTLQIAEIVKVKKIK
jgi:hypothetical protein